MQKTVCTGKSFYQCVVCEKTFATLQHLIVHSRTHQSSILDRHKLMHIQEESIKSDDCKNQSYPIGKVKRLYSGKRTNNGRSADNGIPREYECDICDKRFSKPRYLSQHQKTHTGRKPYKCDVCERRFLLKHHMKRHKSTLHPTLLKNSFEHRLYEGGFRNNIGIQEHKMTHSIQESMLLCDTCGNEVFHSQDFQENVPERSREDYYYNQYDCNKCTEYFSDFKSLIEHHAMDHGALYRCDSCQDLDVKCLTDIGYVCHQCNETFGTCREFFEHIDTHGKVAFNMSIRKDACSQL